jgi:titin
VQAPPFGAGEVQAPNPQAPATEAGAVTNANDTGPGSLRQALIHAGSTPGTTIRFNIPNTDPNFKAGVFAITPLTSLPAVKGAGTIIDGSSQTAFTGDTNKAGPEIWILSSAGTRRRSGIFINSSKCVVKSLTLSSILDADWGCGIQIAGPGASGNRVVGCYIGVDPTGTTAMGSRFGIAIESGANNNTIGGTTPETRNAIAGNGRQLSIEGAGTSGNMVQGNYIGTSADGEKAFRETDAIGVGGGAAKNSIGGNVEGAGNLIVSSGRRAGGVRISGRGSNGNIVQGNLIGTNKTGLKLIGDTQFGVAVLNDVENTQIGGTTPQAGNLIVGGRSAGVQLSYNSNNIVQGNFIGCDITGKATLGNGDGVMIYVGTGNIIGGSEPGAGNVIGGGTKSGVVILGEVEPTTSTKNVVQGNFIGVAADGKTPLPNGDAGVRIAGGSHNNIVGLATDGKGAGNTIAFNKARDVKIMGDEKLAPTGNVIAGNTSHDNGE